jgi:hypothetical protein
MTVFLATGEFSHLLYECAMEDMLMHPTPLVVLDWVGPALGAIVFVALMSLVAEPTRRTLNAIILAARAACT